MQDEILTFEIDNWKILEEDQYISLGELYIVNVGLNPNQTYFSEESILDASNTLPNKPIVCQFNNFGNPKASDFNSHAKNDYDKEVRKIVGVVPNPSNSEMVDYNNGKYLKCRVVFFKHYYPDIINKLIDNDKQGKRTKISMEIAVKEATKREDGVLDIKKFMFLGISLLGNDIDSGIDKAGCFMLKYSNEELDMINEANKRLVTYEIPSIVKDNVRNALETKQKNPKLIHFAKDILNNDVLTYSKIESIKDKIDHVRKDENLNFYGGIECKDWCNKILGYEEGDNTGMGKQLDYSLSAEQKRHILDNDIAQYKNKEGEYECRRFYIRDFDDEYVYAEDGQEGWKVFAFKYTLSEDGLKANIDIESRKEVVKGKYIIIEDEENPPKTYDEIKDEYEKLKEEFEKKEKELENEKGCYELKVSELTETNTTLTQEFAKATSELEELRTYKLENEKEKLEFQANELLAKKEYEGLVTEDEKVKLFESLYANGYKQFEQEFSTLVLPKIIAKQATIPMGQPQEQHYSAPLMGDLSSVDENKATTPFERAKERVKNSGLL